jgi:hypothetical protein
MYTLIACCLLPALAATAAPDNGAPTRPAGRAQAVAVISGGGPAAVACLTPLLQSLRADPTTSAPSSRRALLSLTADQVLASERRVTDPDGSIIRFTTDRASFDRVDPSDLDADGIPDVVESVRRALADARRLLVQEIGLPSPGPVEIVLAGLGAHVEGYAIPTAGRDAKYSIVLDASPKGGPAALRRSCVHQFGHVVALAYGSAVPASQGEALASWAVLKLDHGPDPRTAASVAARLDRLHEGLATDDFDLASGNAAFIAFLDEAYGPTAVRLVFDELSAGWPLLQALDRALRRGTGESLVAALREFQLWSLLVGNRADGHHFSFADRIPSPQLAPAAEGLPALSVKGDPVVAPFGAARVLIRPGIDDGGMTLVVEGEIGARWEADLLLVGADARLTRSPIAVSAEGRGETTIPLERVSEVILLVRNLDADSRRGRRFTWSAYRSPGYPFELAWLEARPADRRRGALVTWETRSEHPLLGFNLLRRRDGSNDVVRINPIWVPAVGDLESSTAYQFLDTTAEPEARYAYWIEAITPEGLTSETDPVSLTLPPSRP